MPVVATRLTMTLGEDFKRVVRVNKAGIFKSKLPESVERLTGVSEVESRTLKGVVQDWENEVRKAANLQTSVEKVIVYNFKYRVSEEGWYKKEREKEGDFAFEKGICMVLYAGVYEMKSHKNAKNEVMHRTFDAVESSLTGGLGNEGSFGVNSDLEDYSRMPWTEEREAFFCHIGDGLVELIEKVEGFLGDQNKKKLLSMINDGVKLLADTSDTPREPPEHRAEHDDHLRDLKEDR